MHIRTAWNDFFTGTPTLIQKNEYRTKQTLSGSSVHVSNCLCRSISSTGRGGALYCSSVTYLLIESTSFFSCTTSNDQGGAIFFTSCSQCIFHGVCGYDCYSYSSVCQFSYVNVKNATSSKNNINYSSIVSCVNGLSSSYYTICLSYGKNYCPSVNMSMNKCQCYSGILADPISDPDPAISSFSFSSFVDNVANGYSCFYLMRSGANYEFKSCNILRNTQGTLGTEGTIRTSGNVKIEDCCILENRATYIFYSTSTSSYRYTLSNCTVDTTSNNGCLATQNAATKSFIIALNHLSTQNCHSEYDSAGALTPFIQTPTSSKKQILCFTNGNYFCQSQLRYLVSLISVAIFNFIHLDASNYPLN
jgi:hypothetical protein